MTVLDFCRTFDVPHQCVYDKIHRKPEFYEQYLTRNTSGRITDISPEVFDLLLPKDRFIEKLKRELSEIEQNINISDNRLSEISIIENTAMEN